MKRVENGVKRRVFDELSNTFWNGFQNKFVLYVNESRAVLLHDEKHSRRKQQHEIRYNQETWLQAFHLC